MEKIWTCGLSVPQHGEAWIYQGIAFPRGLYANIKDRPLRLMIDYSLTLLLGNSYTIPALAGVQALPGLERCTTATDDEGDDIELRCMQAGRAASCASAFLEHVPSGRKNPEAFSCCRIMRPFGPIGSRWYEPVRGRNSISRPLRFGEISSRCFRASGITFGDPRLSSSRPFHPAIGGPSHSFSDWEPVEHVQVAEIHPPLIP